MADPTSSTTPQSLLSCHPSGPSMNGATPGPTPDALTFWNLMNQNSAFQNFLTLNEPLPPPPSENQFFSSLFNNTESHLLTGFLDNVVEFDNVPYPPFFPSHTPLPPQSPGLFEPQISQTELDAFVEYYHRSNSIDSNSTLSQSDMAMNSSSSGSSYNQINSAYPFQTPNFSNMMPYSNGGAPMDLRSSIPIAVAVPVPVPVPVLHPNYHNSKPLHSIDMKRKKKSLTKPKVKKEPMSPKKRGAPKKELLSAAQRRANHIASEQKRRGMIRHGFEELGKIVPDVEGNTSKAVILALTHNFIEQLEQQNNALELIANKLESQCNM